MLGYSLWWTFWVAVGLLCWGYLTGGICIGIWLIVGLVLVSLICVFMHCVSLVDSARLCDCELLLGVVVGLGRAGCIGGRLEVLLFWY